MAVGRMEHAEAALDVQTGGGEVLAWVLGQAHRQPSRLVTTESWRPMPNWRFGIGRGSKGQAAS